MIPQLGNSPNGGNMNTLQVSVTSGSGDTKKEKIIDVDQCESLEEAMETHGESEVLKLFNRQFATNRKNAERLEISERNLVPDWVNDKINAAAEAYAGAVGLSYDVAIAKVGPGIRSAFRKGELSE